MTEAAANKLTILVVDDSRLMRVAARKILKNEFDILEASDGDEAWDVLQASPHISLVMSDLSMPNLDGLGLLKRIRESDSTKLQNLPVIIVTGAEDDDGSKNTALAAGASDFITKPFESVHLLARAKAQAKQQITQQALQTSEASKEKLEAESSIDPLTGLDNQRSFVNHIEEGISYARRHHTELALVMVQIEKYKVLFLRRGKQAAEEVLRRAAQALKQERRREDKVARIGMDTFALLLPSATTIGARRVAEQIHQDLRSQDFNIDGETVLVRTSLAITCTSIGSETTAKTLLDDVTARLEQALKSGGDCIECEDDTVPSTTDSSVIVDNTKLPEELLEASSTDVKQALQAIAHQRQTELDTTALARAVLPLLQAWSSANKGICATQLEDIQNALRADQNQVNNDLASTPG